MASIATKLQQVRAADCCRLCCRATSRAKRHVAGGEQDLRPRGGARGPCRRPACLRRELCAGGAGQDRRTGRSAAVDRVAPDRPAAEQQDARGRGSVRLGPQRRSPEDRRAPVGAAPARPAAAAGVSAGQHQRRDQQERGRAGRCAGAGACGRCAAERDAARIDGDPRADGRLRGTARTAPARCANCSMSLRCGGPGARHAVDGHERRSRGCDRRRRDDRARGYGDLR